jgi:hypothetical protein
MENPFSLQRSIEHRERHQEREALRIQRNTSGAIQKKHAGMAAGIVYMN